MKNILVFAESADNTFKKSTQEAISYAREIAETAGGSVTALVIGAADGSSLGTYGAHQVVSVDYAGNFTSDAYSTIIAEVAKSIQADLLVISNTYSGKSVAPRVAAVLDASLATNVISLPVTTDGFAVKRGVFSGKAFAWVNLTKSCKVLSITPNSFEIKAWGGDANKSTSAISATSGIAVEQVNKVTGKIALTEAEVVISGGRGLKGPENWGMIEELADALGAATACSKPVSDMGWRPHSEHVGQTGITIKPNLYIAVGISGAIQHLAGVSSSKVIVAINKDPEAPFFKAADYGIVGDAFDVLPKIIAAAKN